jgi:hypothetical protein
MYRILALSLKEGSPIKRPLSRGKTNPVRENVFSR